MNVHCSPMPMVMVMVMAIVNPAQASNKLGGTTRMLSNSLCDQRILLDRALQRSTAMTATIVEARAWHTS